MTEDLTQSEIIKQLESRIKELEENLYQNVQSSFNVVKYFFNKNKPKHLYTLRHY